MKTVALVLGSLIALSFGGHVEHDSSSNEYTVQPGAAGEDDAAAIVEAFSTCGQDGPINFLKTTYHTESVMNITGLKKCNNRSSAFFFGGENLTFGGHGYGTFIGNGQAWYDYVNGVNNYPGRPHALTIWNTHDSKFQGINFMQSQMWTMEVMYSMNVLLQDIFVNNTSSNDKSDQNSDGADTLYSDNITFRRWYVENGDDSISAKQNSSNIYIEDCIFKRGLGVALGSIGQYPGEYEFIDGVYAKNVTLINTAQAGYIKTWTGEVKGTPPNGGGGGTGVVRNIKLENFSFQTSKYIVAIGQCTSHSFNFGGCDTSTMAISTLTLGPFTGSLAFEPDNVRLQCRGARPCPGIEVIDWNLIYQDQPALPFFNCSNVVDPVGFTCNETSPSS